MVTCSVTVGRFLTRDTYTGEEDDPLSLHLYSYCGYDGVNAWDPSGHGWLKNYTKYKLLLAAKEYLVGHRYHVTYDLFFHALYGEVRRYASSMLKEELFNSRQYKAYKEKQKKILRKNRKEKMYVDWTGIEYKEGDL